KSENLLNYRNLCSAISVVFGWWHVGSFDTSFMTTDIRQSVPSGVIGPIEV
ncbi:hypothetical protein GWI33_002210, partial [Rhynchophorus ferrugineus]